MASSPRQSEAPVLEEPEVVAVRPTRAHPVRLPTKNARQGLLVVAVLSVLLACHALEIWAPLGIVGPLSVAWTTLLTAAFLWMSGLVPLHATGLIVLLMNLAWLRPVLAASGKEVTAETFLAPFFSDIILLFLGGFVLSAALHARGLDLRLASHLLSRTRHSAHRCVAVILVVTAALSMWLSNTATAAMMLALCLPVVAQFPERHPMRKALLLAVPLGANIGGLGTPIGTPPNAIALEYLKSAGVPIGFGQWMAVGLPGVVVLLGLAYATLRVLFRSSDCPLPLDVGGGEHLHGRLGWGGRLSIFVSVLAVVGWTTGSWHGQSPGTVALLAIVLLVCFRVITLDHFRALPWDVLILMGGGLTLGTAIEVSGLAEWVIASLPRGGDALLIGFAVVACVMSSVMSNTATANLLMPVIAALGQDQVPALLLATAFACSLAMPLPISTPPNAIAFASGELESRDMLRPGLAITAIGLILALTTGLWWWGFLGLI